MLLCFFDIMCGRPWKIVWEIIWLIDFENLVSGLHCTIIGSACLKFNIIHIWSGVIFV